MAKWGDGWLEVGDGWLSGIWVAKQGDLWLSREMGGMK